MIYLDNIIYFWQKAGGISVYWYEITKRILQDMQSGVLFIEQGENTDNIFRNKLDIEKNKIIYEKKIPLKLVKHLPLQIKLPGKSVFHSSYYRVSNERNIANVVTVHDFIYEYFRRGLPRFIHHHQKEYAIKRADRIICISENTQRDLFKFFPFVQKSKVRVVYNGVSEDYYDSGKVDEETGGLKAINSKLQKKNYILYVGDRSPYKNFRLAVDVLCHVGKKYNLVIVGNKDLSGNERSCLEQKLKGRWFYLQGINNKCLNILYNFAFCLLYPSSYEGFGIPIVEAMKTGCPVVAAKTSSIPEVFGDAGIMVDNMSVENFIQAIVNLEDEEYRENVVRAGLKRAKFFSWEKTYEETVRVYRELLI